MTAKHTPGPWTVREITGPGYPGQIGYAIDYNADQEQILDFVYEEADAYLIGAAPELLEALEDLVRAVDLKMPDAYLRSLSRNAHIALAKAKNL